MSEEKNSKAETRLRNILKDLYNVYIYMDGEFVKEKDARVSVFDHGFLYGDGVFEGIRAYDGKIFKLDEHIDRLYDSAKAIGINIPINKEQIRSVVIETLRKNNLRDAHIRPVITRGPGTPDLNPKNSPEPTVIVMAYPMPLTLGDKPVKLITASIRKKSPYSIDARVKSLNYLDNVLAKLQANVVGVDDAIMLDLTGFVTEGTGQNLFIVKSGKIYTPPTTAALHGITRATVIELADRLGYECREKNLTVHELYTADEAFLTGTAAEIVSISEVDGRKMAYAPGHITTKLRNAFKKHVQEEHVTLVY